MRTWFAVENSLVDRNDLTAYEKLCGMVLARYAGRPEFDHLLTTDIIAVKMGVSAPVALEALRGLVRKGLIDAESTSDLFVEGSNNHIRDIELEELQEPSPVIKDLAEGINVETPNFDVLDTPTEVDGIADVDEMNNLESDFDNLDKILGEMGASNQSLTASEEIQEPNITESNKPTPYNRGVASYQTAKKMVDDVVATIDEAESLDPEVLTKSIHEQSDSVRAWIEESESSAPPVTKKPISDREQLVEKVMEMIEEPINDRQARIILGLAEYDLERVQKCYIVAQNTQVSDKIDMLIHELQKREQVEEPKRVPRTSQVDHVRLDQMKKYQAMKKNK